MSKNNFNDAVYINAEALELELARFLDKKAAHTQATILTPMLNKAFAAGLETGYEIAETCFSNNMDNIGNICAEVSPWRE